MFSGLYEQVKMSFTNTSKPREDTVFPDSSKNPLYHDYQQRAIIGLTNSDLKERRQTTSNALESSNHYGELRVQTRDLYLKGPVERYDFCTELLDSSVGPFPLDCLQSEFIRQGGQRTGYLFPGKDNESFWNSKKKWLHVKDEIQSMISRTLSEKPGIKEEAMLQFYGVGLPAEHLAIEPEYGVELFWFTHSTDITAPTVFLGRRIRAMVPYLNNNTVTPGSLIFFTSIVAHKRETAQYRVSSFSGFSLYFNSSVTKVYNNKMASTGNELASLHNGGNATMESALVQLTENVNRLSGYLYYGAGNTYYKLEILSDEFGPGWKEIPRTHLQLTQEPFAPMISFEIEKNPATFGCDYPLCDKRLGGFKMKWENDGWGGPSLQYRGDSVDQMQFPLRKHYFSFPNGRCAIKSKFGFRLSSFMTLTMLITMRSCPKDGSVAKPLCFFGKAAGAPTLHVRELGPASATVNIGNYNGTIVSKDGPIIQRGFPTLLVIRMLRKKEDDPSSLHLIQIGAARVLDLQQEVDTKKILKQSTPLQLPNLASEESAIFKIQSENMGFDFYWLHLFDYNVEGSNLYREAKADWGYLP